MDSQQYLDIFKTTLKKSGNNFGFMQENKQRFKFYQDNDPKHKSNMVRMWLPYNCGSHRHSCPKFGFKSYRKFLVKKKSKVI